MPKIKFILHDPDPMHGQDIGGVACLLTFLHTPESTVANVDGTTALMGGGAKDETTYEWSYMDAGDTWHLVSDWAGQLMASFVNPGTGPVKDANEAPLSRRGGGLPPIPSLPLSPHDIIERTSHQGPFATLTAPLPSSGAVRISRRKRN